MTALEIYLNDHLAVATGGLELFKRAAAAQPEVQQLTDEVAADRAALRAAMRTLGVGESTVKTLGAWGAEKVGRVVKLNGSWLRRAPLSDLVELEGMLLVTHHKAACWQSLIALDDPRLAGGELPQLAERAAWQLDELDGLRLRAARRVLRG